MPIIAMWMRSARLGGAIGTALVASLSAQAPADVPDLGGVLNRVGNRIEEFYKRAQSLMCVEKVTAQPIGIDMSLQGFARVLEYELRVEVAASDTETADANFVRDLRKINGRAPRPKDLDDRNTCLDPNPLTPEPLSFLLAKNRAEYVFSWAGYGKGKDQNSILIDYRPVTEEKPAFSEDEKGREDCFQISLPSERKGRVWIDRLTSDVLRIEQHLSARVDVRVPFAYQRRHQMPDRIIVDRFDVVTRYKPVAFDNPEETLLLPASIEQLAILHGAQSNRKTQVFTNYKRFLTAGRIVK
jgi:hypothetical protein